MLARSLISYVWRKSFSFSPLMRKLPLSDEETGGPHNASLGWRVLPAPSPRIEAAALPPERKTRSSLSLCRGRGPTAPDFPLHRVRFEAPASLPCANGSVKANVVPRSGFGAAQILPP